MGQHSTIGVGRNDDPARHGTAEGRGQGAPIPKDDERCTAAVRGGVLAEVRRIIELIRPAVQSDGGDLELVEVTSDGVVRVRFHGACVGCPSSTLTLQSGIERSLRDRVEGVIRVEAVA